MAEASLIAVLNNNGVSCFQAGDYASSLELFRRALQATIGNLQPEPQREAQGGGCSLPASSNAFSDKEPSPSAPPQSQQVAEDSASVNSLHAYTRAINLIPCESAYSLDPLMNTTIVSSIILFNLGLVYHVKGLEGFDNAYQARLFKARSLYMKVRTLLTEAGISSQRSSSNPVIDILNMAVFNNLGQSAFYLSEYEQSRFHFEELVAFATTVKPTEQHDEETIVLIEWHKSIFLLNAVTLQPPTLASAA